MFRPAAPALGRAAAAAALLAAVGGAAASPPGDAEVVFGMCAPFSGTEKEFGHQLRLGYELAFAAQNEAGGVHGRKLRSYISARVLIEALQRAGRELTMDRLVEGFEAIRGLDLGIGVPVSFAPSEHQGSHKVWGTVIDGKANFRALDLE